MTHSTNNPQTGRDSFTQSFPLKIKQSSGELKVNVDGTQQPLVGLRSKTWFFGETPWKNDGHRR